MEKLPISAIVASFNESHLLEDCLKSIQFCDEIVVVNLNSKDDTERIANLYCTKYFLDLEDKPYFDAYHPKYLPNLKHDWFLLIDPDERIMPELANDIKETLATIPDNVSAIRVPMINYFKGKKLYGTIYGDIVYARLLYNKNGVIIGDEVHSGIKMKEGYLRKKIKFTGNNYDLHLWCNSWKQLLNKHKRYITGEGKVLFDDGFRYSIYQQIKTTIIKFYYNFKTLKGYKDGLKGFVLSILEARYNFLSWNQLKKYQKNNL